MQEHLHKATKLASFEPVMIHAVTGDIPHKRQALMMEGNRRDETEPDHQKKNRRGAQRHCRTSRSRSTVITAKFFRFRK